MVRFLSVLTLLFCGGHLIERGTSLCLVSRRLALLTGLASPGVAFALEEPETVVTSSGLQYQDFKQGKGEIPRPGQRVTIDYVMQTSGARYGTKITSTIDRNEPFSFVLGSNDVIPGLNEAVASMTPGTVRRAIIPASLGYTRHDSSQQPIPSDFAEFQRFKNIYLNVNRPYSPDLILDIKLFKSASSSS